MKPRNQRSDSISAALQAAQNVAEGPREPLPHTPIPEGARPFWDAIMRNKPRDRWNDVDLAHAANLARCQFDIERLQQQLDAEGDLVGDLFVGKLNPKHKLLETLHKRAAYLSRLIHVHTEATVGRVQDAGNALQLERRVESAGNVHHLIARRA